MKRLFTTVLLASGLALSGPVAAQQFSYDYVDVGVYDVEPDGLTSDTTLKVRGSLNIMKNVNLTAGYFSSSHGFFDRDVLSIGGFYHTRLQKNFDIYGGLRFINDMGDADEAGLGLEGGVRMRPVQKLEIATGIRHNDVYNDTETMLFGRGIYEFTKQFGAGAEIEIGDTESLFLFGRMNF